MQVQKHNQIVASSELAGQELIDWIAENIDTIIYSHKSGNTRSTYTRNGKRFLEYLQTFGFSPTIVERYSEYLKARTDIKKTTKSAHATAACVLLERTSHFRSDLLPLEIMLKLTKYVKWERESKRHIKRGISEAQNVRIKEYIESFEDGYKRTRFQAMHALLLLQGLRASELIRITVEDIDFDKGTLNTIRKGKKEHEMFVFTDTLTVLNKYLSFHAIESGYIFKSQSRNQKDANEHITRTSLGELWREQIFKPLGIKMSIHDFRHTLAGRADEITGGSARKVKNVLGHESITTSQSYIDELRKTEEFVEIDDKMRY